MLRFLFTYSYYATRTLTSCAAGTRVWQQSRDTSHESRQHVTRSRGGRAVGTLGNSPRTRATATTVRATSNHEPMPQCGHKQNRPPFQPAVSPWSWNRPENWWTSHLLAGRGALRSSPRRHADHARHADGCMQRTGFVASDDGHTPRAVGYASRQASRQRRRPLMGPPRCLCGGGKVGHAR